VESGGYTAHIRFYNNANFFFKLQIKLKDRIYINGKKYKRDIILEWNIVLFKTYQWYFLNLYIYTSIHKF